MFDTVHVAHPLALLMPTAKTSSENYVERGFERAFRACEKSYWATFEAWQRISGGRSQLPDHLTDADRDVIFFELFVLLELALADLKDDIEPLQKVIETDLTYLHDAAHSPGVGVALSLARGRQINVLKARTLQSKAVNLVEAIEKLLPLVRDEFQKCEISVESEIKLVRVSHPEYPAGDFHLPEIDDCYPSDDARSSRETI